MQKILFTVFLLANFCLLPISQAAVIDKSIKQKYLSAFQDKGSDYQPRTEHFNEDGTPKYINRLIFEESPYLIQHAHNPVNWYPWGAEAFAKAKRENKPVFLSIGYSTCHWCHVMERESFDNEAIAAYLNKHFIAIKVDRERRPDVDKVYMTALTMIKGSGGWPMSSMLTPQGKPFYSGTYFPPVTFVQVLKQVAELWQSEEKKLRDIADNIAAAVQARQAGEKQAGNLTQEHIQIAAINLMNQFDELQGGFSQAPKFPNETYLFLLLDMAVREQNTEILNALKLTMNLMAQGGIYDQVGGGFHRYSTDNEWLVPHFEKMLYNQAHLIRIYLELYLISHDINYERVIKQTLNYVLIEMKNDSGVFYSAGDADSEGREGQFFLWTMDEIQQTLAPDLARLAIKLYGVSKAGNFSESGMTEGGESIEIGSNILNLPLAITEYAKENQLAQDKLYRDIDSIRKKLYQKRQNRIAPALDKKVVTAWNAMMITALTQVGMKLKKVQYIDAAKKAAHYLWTVHHSSAGLMRASLNGRASVTATQADYAYLAQAYLSLYDATQEVVWLERAELLTQEMIQFFLDEEDGTFYMSNQTKNPGQDTPLFSRPKDLLDGAIPSANAIALEVLARLYRRTGKADYRTKAMAQIAALSSRIIKQPAAYSYFLMAVQAHNSGEISDIQYGGKGHVRFEISSISQKQQSQRPINLPVVVLPTSSAANKAVGRSMFDKSIELEIRLKVDKGWHINSRYPMDKDLIATAVSLDNKTKKYWKISRAEYPAGETIKLNFNDTALSLYQNTNVIKLLLEPVSGNQHKQLVSIPLQINYQTCSNSICLAPEMNTLYFFPK
ncbi:MAG: thioredoxin domain-containing protein [gamma proteobacterium symbiont of Taylorina sp.]|nr:thioredoxin domain-containing protein [gamma proteobacterium symbiont of Taylorina sp.]